MVVEVVITAPCAPPPPPPPPHGAQPTSTALVPSTPEPPAVVAPFPPDTVPVPPLSVPKPPAPPVTPAPPPPPPPPRLRVAFPPLAGAPPPVADVTPPAPPLLAKEEASPPFPPSAKVGLASAVTKATPANMVPDSNARRGALRPMRAGVTLIARATPEATGAVGLRASARAACEPKRNERIHPTPTTTRPGKPGRAPRCLPPPRLRWPNAKGGIAPDQFADEVLALDGDGLLRSGHASRRSCRGAGATGSARAKRRQGSRVGFILISITRISCG